MDEKWKMNLVRAVEHYSGHGGRFCRTSSIQCVLELDMGLKFCQSPVGESRAKVAWLTPLAVLGESRTNALYVKFDKPPRGVAGGTTISFSRLLGKQELTLQSFTKTWVCFPVAYLDRDV